MGPANNVIDSVSIKNTSDYMILL